jgi:hypothetical protein
VVLSIFLGFLKGPPLISRAMENVENLGPLATGAVVDEVAISLR